MGLDESNFTRGMLNAQAASKIFGQNVVNFVNNPLLGTIGILKNVGTSIFTAVKEQAFANQELLRSAQRLNTNVELLSALRGSYKGYGQDAEAVERQLTKLNQQIGESNAGNLAAKSNFDALNVALRDNTGAARDFNSVFFDVVEGLGNMEDRSRAVAVAQKLFGEDISRVIEIVGRGRSVLNEFTSQADRLGEVFSAEQVAQANAMADAFDDFGRAVAGVKAQLAQGVISGFIGEEFDSSKISETAQVVREELLPVAESLGRALRDLLETLKQINEQGTVGVIARLAEFVKNFSFGPIPRSGSVVDIPFDPDAPTGIGFIDRIGERRRERERLERQTRALE